MCEKRSSSLTCLSRITGRERFNFEHNSQRASCQSSTSEASFCGISTTSCSVVLLFCCFFELLPRFSSYFSMCFLESCTVWQCVAVSTQRLPLSSRRAGYFVSKLIRTSDQSLTNQIYIRSIPLSSTPFENP